MSNLGVDNIKGSDGSNGPLISGNVVFSGTSHIVLPKGTTAQRPTGVAAGSLRFNTDTKLVEQYNGTDWLTLNSYGVGRGVFGSGLVGVTNVNTIDYITIATLGNAADFGDLTISREGLAACSSSTRGVFGGGYIRPPLSIYTNSIEYITIATTGNATDFGDLTVARGYSAACSSSTRGVIGGGFSNIIDYITLSTTGNATDFGDLTFTGTYLASCSSSIRGIFGGGSTTNIIEYITIATTGNVTDFGDLTVARYAPASCSSSTRGVFGGGAIGPADSNIIDYITIATTGNASDFGDLTQARTALAACSSSTRGVFGGGGGPSNTIDYITIASQGTSANIFGELTVSRCYFSALSDAHGGLA